MFASNTEVFENVPQTVDFQKRTFIVFDRVDGRKRRFSNSMVSKLGSSDFRGLMLITGRKRSYPAHAQYVKFSVLESFLRIRLEEEIQF